MTRHPASGEAGALRLSLPAMIGRLYRQARDRIGAITRTQWVIAGLTLAINVGIVFMLIFESHYGVPKPAPIVAYFKSWEDGRSRADALEAQEAERRLAEEAERIAAELDVAAPADSDPADEGE